MSKKGKVVWSPQQLAEYEKRNGKVELPAEPTADKLLRKRRRKMNGTETRFALVLQAMERKGEIQSFRFEGMTLRWGSAEDFTYTPDFSIIAEAGPLIALGTSGHPVNPPIGVRLRFIEVKGAHIRQKDWDRFKHARDNFPFFEFQLWQWKERTWTRLA